MAILGVQSSYQIAGETKRISFKERQAQSVFSLDIFFVLPNDVKKSSALMRDDTENVEASS